MQYKYLLALYYAAQIKARFDNNAWKTIKRISDDANDETCKLNRCVDNLLSTVKLGSTGNARDCENNVG